MSAFIGPLPASTYEIKMYVYKGLHELSVNTFKFKIRPAEIELILNRVKYILKDGNKENKDAYIDSESWRSH